MNRALPWLCTGAMLLVVRPAYAADPTSPAQISIADQLAALADRVARQQAEIDAQQRQIALDADEIRKLKASELGNLGDYRGAGGAAFQAESPAAQADPSASPGAATTVGESLAPKPDLSDKVQAIPQGQGVLTPKGKTTIQPAVTYLRAANNRLVFAGIELVPGLQIGSIEASTADRNTTIPALTVWHGFTNRLEAEVMVPGMVRVDSIHLAQVRDGTVTEGYTLHKTAIGDVEGAIRWQLNAPLRQDVPIFVASLRVKSDTGVSPYSIAYDEYGIAQGLATGSGFWALQPGLTFLLPSDPAVIYGGVSYLHQIPRTIGRTVGGIDIGHIQPGDAVTGNIGFGFALNPRFSFSLGYSHTYIMRTRSVLNGSSQLSSPLQVGTLDLGMSYRLNQRQSVTFAFQFGVTQDAPGLSVTLRLPFTF